MTISMAGLPAFALYFVVGAALIAAFAVVYLRMTGHDELALIRAGNLPAAIALGGSLFGFALPLERAIAQAASVADCAIWAVTAMVVQFSAYGLCRLLVRNLSQRIEEGCLAAATLLAAVSIVSGSLASASMSL